MKHFARTPIPFGFRLVIACAGLFVMTMVVLAALVVSGVVRS